MTGQDRLELGAVLLDAVLLALIELFYLPLYLGSVPFPITAAVAAVTTPWLVAVAGRISNTRGAAAAPLVVWFLTVLLFGLSGPGGDVLLPGSDLRPLLFIAAGTLPSAIMLGMVLGSHSPRR